jgi:hypothetical protein
VISVRREAWACEVMSNCVFKAVFEVRKSANWSVRVSRVD